MFILILSRGIPSKYHPQWGCFEKDQAEALASFGHKVVVISVDARFDRKRGSLGLHHNIINGVEYYNYVIPPGILFSKILGEKFYRDYIKFHYIYNIYKKIEKKFGKPDIIYSHYFWITYQAVKLKWKTGIPLVGIEHFSRFNEGTLTNKDKLIASEAFKNVDKLITVSTSLSNNIDYLFKVKSKVVPNVIGTEFIKNRTIHNKFKDFTFVSVGSLIKRKGFDILIKAFKLSGLSNKGCQLLIIGEGPEHKNLQSLIKKLNIQNNITLLGQKDKQELIHILSQCQVFVLTSKCETFGVANIEALSAGLPNITTVCGGPEDFIDDKNGILIPVDDIDKTSIALNNIYNNYASYNSVQIRNNCLAKYSPQTIASQLTNIFKQVIDDSIEN